MKVIKLISRQGIRPIIYTDISDRDDISLPDWASVSRGCPIRSEDKHVFVTRVHQYVILRNIVVYTVISLSSEHLQNISACLDISNLFLVDR